MIRAVALALGLLFLPGPARAITFSNWLSGYGITNTNPALDSDGDGISNLTEYALADLDPTVVNGATQLPAVVYGTRATNTVIPWRDASVIVATNLAYPPTSGFWYVGLRYKPRTNTEALRWQPQYAWWAANLSYWLDGRSVFLDPVADGTNGYQIRWMQGMFRAVSPPKSAFLRLKIILP